MNLSPLAWPFGRARASALPYKYRTVIGVKDRLYLDHTGLVRHRSIGDLMRYAALNQDTQQLARYGDFVPEGRGFKEVPDATTQSRYSDEQLYALAKYLYALTPPANPNRFDTTASRGERVFVREGCSTCHTPPLYTNNKLTPAEGFDVPQGTCAAIRCDARAPSRPIPIPLSKRDGERVITKFLR